MFAKVRKGAKISNRYNQVQHLTQDTNGKVTNSQLDTFTHSKHECDNVFQSELQGHYAAFQLQNHIIFNKTLVYNSPDNCTKSLYEHQMTASSCCNTIFTHSNLQTFLKAV